MTKEPSYYEIVRPDEEGLYVDHCGVVQRGIAWIPDELGGDNRFASLGAGLSALHQRLGAQPALRRRAFGVRAAGSIWPKIVIRPDIATCASCNGW